MKYQGYLRSNNAQLRDYQANQSGEYPISSLPKLQTSANLATPNDIFKTNNNQDLFSPTLF